MSDRQSLYLRQLYALDKKYMYTHTWYMHVIDTKLYRLRAGFGVYVNPLIHCRVDVFISF